MMQKLWRYRGSVSPICINKKYHQYDVASRYKNWRFENAIITAWAFSLYSVMSSSSKSVCVGIGLAPKRSKKCVVKVNHVRRVYRDSHRLSVR
jgi:hypothetical protein